MRIRTLVFFLLALGAGMARAAGELTVDAAVKEALGRRPDLARSRAALDAASWKRLETLSGHLPHLSITATHFLDNKFEVMPFELLGNTYEIPAAYPYSTVNLDASLTLFDGFKTINNYLASGLQREAAEKELGRLLFQGAMEVRLKFFQALAAKEVAAASAASVKTLGEHRDVVRLRMNNGLATKLDLLQVEARLEEAKAELISSNDNVFLSRWELTRSMGLQADDRPLSGALPAPNPKDIPVTLSLDEAQRDDLQAKALRSRASEMEAGAANSFWVPSATLFAEKQFYNNQDYSLNPESFQDAYFVGARLNWDLFDGGASLAKSAQAADRAEQARTDDLEARLRAPNELRFWQRRFLYSCALYQARLDNIEKTQESVRLAELGYKNGTRANSEVLDAVLEWMQAKAGSIRAQVDALEAFQNLQLAVGRPLGISSKKTSGH